MGHQPTSGHRAAPAGAGRPPVIARSPEDLRDAIAWRRAQQALASDAVESWQHGSVLRTPSCRGFWDLNSVRVETAGVPAEVMDEAAETLLADYQHRKLFVEDEATGAAVRGYFEERGWMTSHDAMMLRVGPPPPMPQGVREVTLEATRALRRQWYGPSQVDHIAVSEPYAVRRGTRAL